MATATTATSTATATMATNGNCDPTVNGTDHPNAAAAAAAATTDSTNKDANKNKNAPAKPMATVGETMSFMTMSGARIQFIFGIGTIAAIANGMVYPILAYLFSSSFTDIAGAANNGLAQLRELAYTFMIVGVYALACATVQGWCFETVAAAASQKFRLTWFRALLRQDPAFFDVHDIGGLAGQIGPNANKYRRGLGRKFGEIFQFFTTGVGGLAFAFYVSWRVALVVLTVIPFVALSAMATVYYNQTKGQRAAASYKRAGSVAYSSVSSIKTVLSLNAIPEMLRQYAESTTEAFYNATSVLLNQGLANGTYVRACMHACMHACTWYMVHTRCTISSESYFAQVYVRLTILHRLLPFFFFFVSCRIHVGDLLALVCRLDGVRVVFGLPQY